MKNIYSNKFPLSSSNQLTLNNYLLNQTNLKNELSKIRQRAENQLKSVKFNKSSNSRANSRTNSSYHVRSTFNNSNSNNTRINPVEINNYFKTNYRNNNLKPTRSNTNIFNSYNNSNSKGINYLQSSKSAVKMGILENNIINNNLTTADNSGNSMNNNKNFFNNNLSRNKSERNNTFLQRLKSINTNTSNNNNTNNNNSNIKFPLLNNNNINSNNENNNNNNNIDNMNINSVRITPRTQFKKLKTLNMNEQKNILAIQRMLSAKKRKKSYKKQSEDNISYSDEEYSNDNIETERIKKKKKQKDLFRSLSKGLENNINNSLINGNNNRIFNKKISFKTKNSQINNNNNNINNNNNFFSNGNFESSDTDNTSKNFVKHPTQNFNRINSPNLDEFTAKKKIIKKNSHNNNINNYNNKIVKRILGTPSIHGKGFSNKTVMNITASNKQQSKYLKMLSKNNNNDNENNNSIDMSVNKELHIFNEEEEEEEEIEENNEKNSNNNNNTIDNNNNNNNNIIEMDDNNDYQSMIIDNEDENNNNNDENRFYIDYLSNFNNNNKTKLKPILKKLEHQIEDKTQNIKQIDLNIKINLLNKCFNLLFLKKIFPTENGENQIFMDFERKFHEGFKKTKKTILNTLVFSTDNNNNDNNNNISYLNKLQKKLKKNVDINLIKYKKNTIYNNFFIQCSFLLKYFIIDLYSMIFDNDYFSKNTPKKKTFVRQQTRNVSFFHNKKFLSTSSRSNFRNNTNRSKFIKSSSETRRRKSFGELNSLHKNVIQNIILNFNDVVNDENMNFLNKFFVLEIYPIFENCSMISEEKFILKIKSITNTENSTNNINHSIQHTNSNLIFNNKKRFSLSKKRKSKIIELKDLKNPFLIKNKATLKNEKKNLLIDKLKSHGYYLRKETIKYQKKLTNAELKYQLLLTNKRIKKKIKEEDYIKNNLGAINKNNMIYRVNQLKSEKINSLENIEKCFFYVKDRNFQGFKMVFESEKLHPDICDENGNSLLCLAVQGNCFQIVDYLLNLGANPNLKNYNYNTPLHYALTFHNFEIADMLIQRGADEKALNKRGETPWQCLDSGNSII